MTKIIVANKKEQSGCEVFIGHKILEKISSFFDLNKYSKVFIATDKNIKPLFLNKVLSSIKIDYDLLELSSGEKEKNIDTIKKIWTAMHNSKCDRKSLVINLGGGVIGDMGGFAASTFMRGVNFINIPTTLLSQVDASIGGKTGIDFCGIKNLIGTFNQPKAILIDVQTLKTLPKREFLSGFSEIIKHGLINNRMYFDKVTQKHPLQFNDEEMTDIITESCRIKIKIVEYDEKEIGRRKILNFGHTIGHAIETLSLKTNKPLLHGEAISIGMLAEARISNYLKLLYSSDIKLIQDSLKNSGLPIYATNTKLESVFETMRSDKKNEKGIINFTLINRIGNALYDQNVPESIIVKGIKSIIKN